MEGITYIECYDFMQDMKFPLFLNWQRVSDMPFEMSQYPQAVVISGRLYVGGRLARPNRNKRTVAIYDPQHDTWTTLPQYNSTYFAMASVNDQLILVGGVNVVTNARTAVLGAWSEELQKWITPFQEMPTARISPSAFSHSRWLVVIGGRREDLVTKLSNVEILDTTLNQWYCGPCLPQPLSSPSIAIIGHSCYILGGFAFNHESSKKVYRASLDDLISQAVSCSSDTSTSVAPLWHSLPRSPLNFSAALALDGALLSVGGEDDHRQVNKAIYFYQLGCRTWVKVGDLHIARSKFACKVLPGRKMIVAGGTAGNPKIVEIAQT